MRLQELIPGSNAARDDVQQTAFGCEVLPRYICNNWQEILAAQGPGAYPFEARWAALTIFGRATTGAVPRP